MTSASEKKSAIAEGSKRDKLGALSASDCWEEVTIATNFYAEKTKGAPGTPFLKLLF